MLEIFTGWFPKMYMYISNHINPTYNRGNKFTVEEFDDDGKLISKLSLRQSCGILQHPNGECRIICCVRYDGNNEIITKGNK